VASVRRLGVIMFRIAMCLSVLHLIEDGAFEDDITCLDIDYQTAKTIAGSEAAIKKNLTVLIISKRV